MTTLVPTQQLEDARPPGPAGERVSIRRRPARLSWLRRWVSPVVCSCCGRCSAAPGCIPEDKIASPPQIAAAAGELVADGTLGAATLVSVQRVLLGFAVGAVHRAGARRRRRAQPDRRGRRRPADADAAHAAALRPDPAVHRLDGHRRDAEDRADRPRAWRSRSTSTPSPASAASTARCLEAATTHAPHPPPAAAARGRARGAPAGARRAAAEPRRRLAVADRRGDGQRRLRASAT